MARNHSQEHIFIVNHRAPAIAIAAHIGRRQEQINLLVVLTDRCNMTHAERETMHGLVLELGLQQRLLKDSIKRGGK